MSVADLAFPPPHPVSGILPSLPPMSFPGNSWPDVKWKVLGKLQQGSSEACWAAGRVCWRYEKPSGMSFLKPPSIQTRGQQGEKNYAPGE